MADVKTVNSTSSAGQESFDPSKVKKLSFLEILKRIGPGIILTGVVIGPGNITTSAMLGANYGYAMIWLVIPIMFMGVTFMLTSYRISMLTGMPIIHAIRHYYGKVAAGFVGVALFLAICFLFFSCLCDNIKPRRRQVKTAPAYLAKAPLLFLR